MSSAGRERIPKRIGVPILAALVLVLLVPSAASAANSLAVHGSVNQVYVTGAQPGTSLRLVRKGKRFPRSPSVASAAISSAGSQPARATASAPPTAPSRRRSG